MKQALFVALLFASGALAQDGYQRALDQALLLEREVRPGESADLPLNRAYDKLAEAAQMAPKRWEAFAYRGTNRCKKAVVCRQILAEVLSDQRARGAGPEFLQSRDQAGKDFIESCIRSAEHDFGLMQRNMLRANVSDPDLILFATAAVKFARGQYQGGAIDDFKRLIVRRWQVRRCSEFIARCHLQLGVEAHAAGDLVAAHEQWDHGLKWAQEPATRRTLLANKAAAFEMESEWGMTEKILRDQAREEPRQPAHWKNLGMVLGYKNRLREGLHAYARARHACKSAGGPYFPGVLHGNAWLKPAMIHGKLLEEDGDLRTAWRLFLEYREMLGDDYNFSLNFGDFAFHMGEYELAWTYVARARELRPFCPNPHQLLLQVASRLPGTRAEVDERVERVREGLDRAREGYIPAEVPWRLRRLCGGLRDLSDSGRTGGKAELLPALAGADADRPPAWILAAAALRQPFVPFDPSSSQSAETEPAGSAEESSGSRGAPLWVILSGGVLLGGLVLVVRIKKGRHSRTNGGAEG